MTNKTLLEMIGAWEQEDGQLKVQLAQIIAAWNNFDIRLEQIRSLDPTLASEIDDELSEQLIELKCAIEAGLVEVQDVSVNG